MLSHRPCWWANLCKGSSKSCHVGPGLGVFYPNGLLLVLDLLVMIKRVVQLHRLAVFLIFRCVFFPPPLPCSTGRQEIMCPSRMLLTGFLFPECVAKGSRFSRMRSKGFPFYTLGVSGLRSFRWTPFWCPGAVATVCSRLQPSATVRNRLQPFANDHRGRKLPCLREKLQKG